MSMQRSGPSRPTLLIRFKMDVTAAADGILRIAVTAMSYAVKGVTTQRGLDAGDFVLVAYGGAGPLHAVQVAREIGIRRVIIPHAPGVFSAFGMLFSDLRYDYVRTWYTRLEDAAFPDMEAVYRSLEDQGRAAIASTSVKPSRIVINRAMDMRYVGQEHAVTVDLPMTVFTKQDRKAIKRHFDDMHLLRYGTSAPGERAEIVSLRSTVTGLMRKPPQEKIARGARVPAKAGVHRQAQGLFRRRWQARRLRRYAHISPREPARRQSHLRTGIDRGTRLHHRAAGRRYGDGG